MHLNPPPPVATHTCAYCGRTRPAAAPCGCPEQARVHAARRAEVERRQLAQRQGVAVWDTVPRKGSK